MKRTFTQTARHSPKRILSLLLVLALLLTTLPGLAPPVRAEDEPVYSGECGDNLTWSFDPDTGLLTITGSGGMKNYFSYSKAPWYSYRAAISAVALPEELSSIGDYVFYGCAGLTSVTIPESVASIGSSAFYGCAGLTSVTIPAGVTRIDYETFYGCTGLTSITIPEAVTSIGEFAFSGCTGLTSVTIPASVNSVGENAFSGCTSLTEIVIQSFGCSIYADSNTLGVPGTTTVYGYAKSSAQTYAEQYGYSFVSLGSIECSGECGAEGDNLLWTLNTETGLLTITGSGGMKNYFSYETPWYSYRAAISAVALPEELSSIGNYAFYGCAGLTSVTIPEAVTSIGGYAFYGCAGLTSVTIPAGVTRIFENTFYRCTGLTSVTIPESVASIGNYAFYGCAGLTSVTIPAGVTRIDYNTFYGCTGLTSITIPEAVTSIYESAFSGCTGLTSITIPAGVTSVGENAFSGCTSLTEIVIQSFGCSIYGDSYTLGVPGTTTVYGYEKSTAQTYAEQYGYRFVSLGNLELSGECGAEGDNLLWTLNTETGLLTITGSGAMANFNSNSTVPWYAYRTAISAVILPEELSSIGHYAFYGCAGLTSVTIPESVASIGGFAFGGCSKLTELTVKNAACSIYNSNYTLGYPGTTTIYGYLNSTADRYARQYGYQFVPLVDLELSGECGAEGDNLLWTLTTETGLLTISGAGKMADFSYHTAPWYDYNIAITAVALPAGLTSIGSYAFENCVRLTSASFPEGLAGIGRNAFSGCTGLTSASFPESLVRIDGSAFSGCAELTSVTLPESIETVGSSAFASCNKLTEVTVKSTACYIGYGQDTLGSPSATTIYGYFGSTAQSYARSFDYRFVPLVNVEVSGECGAEGDNLLWTLNTETGLLTISGAGNMANYSNGSAPWYDYNTSITTAELPAGLGSIGDYAFSGCNALTSINIPAGVTSIGHHAFYRCRELASAAIPESVVRIGEYAFYECAALTSVTIPESVVRIGEYAFYGCAALTSVTIPAGVAGIGQYTFNGCTSLTQVTISAGVADIGKHAFSGAGLGSVIIPASVASIGDYAFSGCTKLSSVTLQEGLVRIGSYAFSGCSRLSSVTIPAGLTVINQSVFSDCTSLRSVTFPEGLTSVGSSAFYNCTSLTSVTLPESLDTVGSNAFARCSTLTKVEVMNPGCNIYNGTNTLGIPGTTTIYGYNSSSAQYYAEQYGYRFISLGDSALYGFCGAEGENLRWQFYPDSGLLEITGSGAMREYTNSQSNYTSQSKYLPPWKDYEITELSLPEGLTRIGDFAFFGQDGLCEINLPASLNSVGESAFQGCTGLKSVKLPQQLNLVGHNAFKNCTQLKKLFVQNPACRVESLYLHADETAENLQLFDEYPDTLGTPGETVIYGAHDAQQENNGRIRIRQVPGRSENHMYYGFYAEEFAKRFEYQYFSTNAFSDVTPGSYYEIPVAWAVGMGITSGTGDGQFSPKKTCTREQVMSFLYAAEGKPGHEATESPFTDVKPGKYYYHPVMWAVENKITGGVSDTLFGVGRPCTREQVVSFLWKAAGSPEPESTESPFTDVTPGKYYYKPVLWAVEHGVTSGVSATSFGVGKSCTRAQIVTFLYAVYGS